MFSSSLGVVLALTFAFLCLSALLRMRYALRLSGPYDLTDMGRLLRSRWQSDFDINTAIDVPVIYINLERSLFRRERMMKEFEDLRFKTRPFRLKAVDGREYLLDPSKEPWIHPSLHRLHSSLVDTQKASPEEIGCLLSHIKAIFEVYSRKWRLALILEDDVDFSCAGLWGEPLSSLAQRAPRDWDFIQLHRITDHCFEKKPLGRGMHLRALYKRKHPLLCWSAAAYLVSDRASERFYKTFSEGGMLSERYFWLAIQQGCNFVSDHLLYNIFPDINIYLEDTVRFTQYNQMKELDSTIHPDHTPNHIDTSLLQLRRYLDKNENW